MDRTEVNASPVQKAPQGIKKYKYVLLTALLGVLLLLLPQNEKAADSGSATPSAAENFDREALQNEMEDILSSLDCVVQALMLLLPANKGARRDAESLGNLVVRGSLDCQRPSPIVVVFGIVLAEGRHITSLTFLPGIRWQAFRSTASGSCT